MTFSKQLGYTFTTIADTTSATFEFSPTGVPIPTAPAHRVDDACDYAAVVTILYSNL